MNFKVGKHSVVLMTGQIDDSAAKVTHFGRTVTRNFDFTIAKVVVRGRCFGFIVVSGK